ncbi:E3 SUMO-protein ligase MMS21-like [Thrips palmi]|uniref:E3 SUMO-protein ligase NSE2 n=1 Tax=Thrips palmi TaxID=161013 RepID=A0A6P9A795_THRPL|nr:E3 SUMO-protein ligase MMS21-like [Thrips palmi]
MDDYSKREKDIIRTGIQEALLCSEFAIKYLDQGPGRDQHLQQITNLVKNYCLLDHHLQARPNVIASMSANEAARLAQRENAENPGPVEDTIPDYSQIFSQKVKDATKNVTVENHAKFKDFHKKVQELVNKQDGTGDGDDVMYTEESENYLDPISKTELVDPVISTKCRHRFSRKSIMEHLRGKSFAQCPIMGCSAKFSAEDFEDDLVTAQTLRRRQLNKQI